VKKQCELLGISRSGYYYNPKPASNEQLQLLNIVDEIYTKYPFFGTRKMASYLKRHGHNIGRKGIRTIYETLGLEAVYPKPNLSLPNKEHLIYPYLLRDVAITHCDQVWSTDITYIRLNGGFVYLMAIIDWHSRFVLDWEVSVSLDADFCIETLQRLLRLRSCEIFNTDQGSQFTSREFTGTLLRNKIKISMDSKGRFLDNIFVERLWRSVKYECIYLLSLDSVRKAREEIKKYFEFYNNERPHQSLNNKTPAEIYFAGSAIKTKF
jgi:putative transposase